jgi:transcription elongation factor GreA
MGTEKIFLTVEGERALRARLKRIREVERPQNVRDIEEARSKGDLSENAEYHAAKERQGILEAQARELADKLSRAQVIDPKTLSGTTVVFGATVKLQDLDNDEEVEYQIVGAEEADPKLGRISYTAPLGRALIRKQLGDTLMVKTPGGTRQYEILEVSFR